MLDHHPGPPFGVPPRMSHSTVNQDQCQRRDKQLPSGRWEYQQGKNLSDVFKLDDLLSRWFGSLSPIGHEAG